MCSGSEKLANIRRPDDGAEGIPMFLDRWVNPQPFERSRIVQTD
jgi:hypothetical protein